MSTTAPRASRGPQTVGLPTWLAGLGIVLFFAMPGQVIDLLGFGYGMPGGSPIGKVHPGTDLVILAFLLTAMRAGNPLRFFATQGRRFPGGVALLGATALLLIYLVKVQRAPFTPLIDTFFLPPLLLPLLVDMPDKARRQVELFLHLFFAINAILGIVEFVAGWRLIPLTIEGLQLTQEMEWRASGLLGHPLSSAAAAGLYAVIITMGFGKAMPNWLRAPAIALQFVSLAAFGGRTALVLTAVCLIVILLLRGGELLLGRRFDRRSGAAMLLMAMVVMLGVAALMSGGFFDQLLQRFVDDNGSAKSRSIIFDVLRQLSWQELWLGPDQEHVESVLHLEGIEVGVESFWLGLIVLTGMWMAGLFFTAVGCFFFEVLRRADVRALVPLGFFLIIQSTYIGLSVKSLALAQFATMVIILMPAIPRRATAPVPSSVPRWRPA